MTRLLAVAAVTVAVLFALPVAVALACTALVPALLAPTLAGASDQTDPLPVPSSTRSGPQPSGDRAPVLAWAVAHVGQPYRMGAAGPSAWDCSSFSQAAYSRVGVQLPRTAEQQRDWLAAGHGTRIAPGHEQPADLIYWDSYLGPAVIGHVVLVEDPTRHRTVEAHNTRAGTGYFTYRPHHRRYEIWRPFLPTQHQPTQHQPGRGAR